MTWNRKDGALIRRIGGYECTTLKVSDNLKTNGWVGGQALALTPNGLDLPTVDGATGASDVHCIALLGKGAYIYGGAAEGAFLVEGKNYDAGNFPITTIHGHALLYLQEEDINGMGGKAFEATPASGAWAIGDHVYLNTNLKWDNAPINSEAPYGKVVDVVGDATDPTALVIDFYNVVR